MYYLRISLFLANHFRTKIISVAEKIVVGDESIQGIPNNIDIKRPQWDTQRGEINETKVSVEDDRTLLKPSRHILSKSQLTETEIKTGGYQLIIHWTFFFTTAINIQQLKHFPPGMAFVNLSLPDPLGSWHDYSLSYSNVSHENYFWCRDHRPFPWRRLSRFSVSYYTESPPSLHNLR